MHFGNGGGIGEVKRRSFGHPAHFGIRLEWQLPDDTQGFYAFCLGIQKKNRGGFQVEREECRVFRKPLVEESFYIVEYGALRKNSFEVGPSASNDRLYLVAASGLSPFRPLYDALSRMGFYNLNPDEIRELQPPDRGEVMKRDGSNLASVLSVMGEENREGFDRVVAFLSKVMPGIQAIDVKHEGRRRGLEFSQSAGSGRPPLRFMAENMSDGTLRALGVLTALFQSSAQTEKRVPFVGIEEPEVAVHPGAAGVLRDGLVTASKTTQIAVTSHSPDLLDDKDIPDESILAVVNRNGETTIAPPDEAGRSAIRSRLYTAGEVLRLNQIEPDEAAVAKIPPYQLDLFADYKP